MPAIRDQHEGRGADLRDQRRAGVEGEIIAAPPRADASAQPDRRVEIEQGQRQGRRRRAQRLRRVRQPVDRDDLAGPRHRLQQLAEHALGIELRIVEARRQVLQRDLGLSIHVQVLSAHDGEEIDSRRRGAFDPAIAAQILRARQGIDDQRRASARWRAGSCSSASNSAASSAWRCERPAT